MVRQSDAAVTVNTIVIHDEVGTRGGIHEWGNYSDHTPMELTIKEAWAWKAQSDVPMQGAMRKPDFPKLCGD